MANHKLAILRLSLSVALLLLNNSTYALDEKRRAQLHNLLIQDCGSCHGMTMQGGLGPALTPEVLKTKSRHIIEATILYGRPGTPMPPWGKLLSGDDVRWLVDKLYSGVTQ